MCVTALSLLSCEALRRSRTHVELQVLCPLAHEAVSGRAGVAAVELEDVVAPRGVPVLVEHHWSASTAWGKQTGQNPTSQHHVWDGVRGGSSLSAQAMQRGHLGTLPPPACPTEPSSLPNPAAWEQAQQGQVSLTSPSLNARNVTRLLLAALQPPSPLPVLRELSSETIPVSAASQCCCSPPQNVPSAAETLLSEASPVW